MEQINAKEHTTKVDVQKVKRQSFYFNCNLSHILLKLNYINEMGVCALWVSLENKLPSNRDIPGNDRYVTVPWR